MCPPNIPDIVIHRLPLYLRVLIVFREQGQTVTSSQELGTHLDISPAQIRKDLSYFGEFGKQGMGYEIEFLISQLKRILQVNRKWNIAIVGAGTLGHSLVSHFGFEHWDFHITAVFDKDPQRIGQRLGNLTVLDVTKLAEVILEKNIQFGIIAVPTKEAQGVAEQLITAGVRAILNYAPISLKIPKHTQCHSIDPVVMLQSMAYYQETQDALKPDEGIIFQTQTNTV